VDGVYIVPGMTVWYVYTTDEFGSAQVTSVGKDWVKCSVLMHETVWEKPSATLFSTRDAAEKARDGK
jgi:hypothetical protein